VKFFNLTDDPTKNIDGERGQRAGGQTQSQSRIAAFNAGAVAGLLTGLVTPGEVAISQGQMFNQIGKDVQTEAHLPNVAASLTAESKSGSPYRFVLTLTPEYEDALIILNSRLFTYSTVAEVRWGYTSADGNQVLTDRHLFVNIYPKVNFGSDITIVIEGYDLFSSYARRNSRRQEWDAGQTIYGIIKTLVERNEPFKLEPDNLTDALLDDSLEHLTDFLFEGILQTLPDLSFVYTLLRRVNLTAVVIGTTIKIFNPIYASIADSAVAYTFRWRQQLTGDHDIPVYSSTGNILPAYFAPATSRGLLAVSYDAEGGSFRAHGVTPKDVAHREPTEGKSGDPLAGSVKKSTVVGSRSTNTTAVTISGGKQAKPNPVSTSGETGVVLPVVSQDNPNEAPKIANTVVQEGGMLSAPRVKLKCPGVPDMFPSRIVKLQGFTDIFDGLYTVLNVKHTVSSGGYDMDVEVIRYSAVSATQSSPAPNTKQVPDGNKPSGEKPKPDPGGTNLLAASVGNQ